MTQPDPLAEQARLNATARDELEVEFGLLDENEVVQLTGDSAAQAANLVSRWCAEGRIFAVDTARYPGFQFDLEGHPVPVVGDVLNAFAGRLTAWEQALWFTGQNAGLGGRRPVDVLTTAPGQVVAAARALADELHG